MNRKQRNKLHEAYAIIDGVREEIEEMREELEEKHPNSKKIDTMEDEVYALVGICEELEEFFEGE